MKSKSLTCNIPKLRFPEFHEDWTIEELGKLGKFLGGGTPSKSVDEYWYGTMPWISSSDISEDDLQTIAITRFINEKSILESATKIIPKGSILFVSRVGTGKLAINSIDLCTSQDFTNFIPTQIYNYFLGYYFLANKSTLTSLDQGTSIKGFSKSDLEKFKLIYPKQKAEQQKIADCLSSIDNLITASTKKCETLKQHKKALMQQLFPTDGEEVPKLRFPEFENSGKWEEKKLGDKDISHSISSGKDKNDHNGTYNLFGSTGIIGKVSNYSYTGNFILVARVGANAGFLTKVDGQFGVTDNTLVIDLLETVNINFVFSLLEKSGLNKLIFGSGQPLITGRQLKELSLFFPKLQEQQKIADCLSSIDELITAQSKKVETLKEHKKGLMQQLFPSGENK